MEPKKIYSSPHEWLEEMAREIAEMKQKQARLDASIDDIEKRLANFGL